MGKIKNKLLFLGTILLISLFIGIANADIQVVDDNIIIPVDYHDFNDEDQKTVAASTQFSLSNTGSSAVTVSIAVDNMGSDYTAESISDVEIQANSTSNPITLSLDVPHEKDAGEEKIGELVITAGSTQIRKDIIQETKSMFEFKKFEVSYTSDEGKPEDDRFDGDDESFSLDENVGPNTEVVLTFRIENLFDNDYDEDNSILENIELKIEADDSDLYESDFDETRDLDDLDAGEDRTFDVSFTVDEDADEGNYDIDIEFEAEDGEGSKYEIKRTLKLDVERIREDIRITKTELSSSEINNCQGGSFSLQVEMKNFGTRDQKFSGLSIYNDKLDINENLDNIDLDRHSRRDNTYSKTFNFPVKTSVKPGKYELEVNSYIDRTELIDTERVDVDVKACSTGEPQQEEEPEEESQQNNTQGSQDTSGQSDSQQGTGQTGTPSAGQSDQSQDSSSGSTGLTGSVVSTIENPYSAEDILVALIVIAIIVILALIIVLFINLLR